MRENAALAQVRIEPRDSSLDTIAVVLGLREMMSLVLVNNQPRFDAHRFERVPKLVGLRSRTLTVTVADEDERGSLHFGNEANRRTFGVDARVFVNRLAEERNHPLVNFVFAVVALPVRDSSSGDRRLEAIRLRDAPHG